VLNQVWLAYAAGRAIFRVLGREGARWADATLP
jgi:hypothetical protein